MSGGTQSLRRRLNELANSRENLGFPEDCDDIRAILAKHKEAKRELHVCKSYLRLLTCANPAHEKCLAIRNGLKREGIKL